MNDAGAAGGRLVADEVMTADRDELTYLVPLRQCRALVKTFDEALPSHRYRGEGENPLPAPEHFVSTVYFDTTTRRLFQAARQSAHDNTKLRAKEYYDFHPSLAELATSVDDVVHAPGQIWLELKRRLGARTQKHRVRMGKSTLARWLETREKLAPGDYVGRDADARVLQAFFDAEPEPLAPTCLVNYQRSSWQSADGELRLTLDSNLAFYAPPPDLFRRRSLLREELGNACAREPSALLEIKKRSPTMPAWLAACLSALGLVRSDYSKFVAAATRVTPNA